MSLPFRRRHHDDESSHDRARSLISAGFMEPLAEPEATWLDAHLARCPECRAERDLYVADRALLRGLRDRMPEPPRDLWARTSAAIEGKSRAGGRRTGAGRAWPALLLRPAPLGVLAGALVVLVVVGTALLPGGIVQPGQSGGPSEVARASTKPGATIVPEADRVAWLQTTPDGGYALVFANVDHACADAEPSCAPLADSSPAPLALAAPPQALVLSPGHGQLAVVSAAGDAAGSVIIVSLPTPRPAATATPGAPSPIGPPSTAPASSAPASGAPSPAPSASVAPGGSSGPSIGHAIVSGVAVVGPVGYSVDGQWFAFSARPLDGSRGPDLYLWHVGDDQARRITDDGSTFFSGWFGNRVVASGIVAPAPVDGASPSPAATADASNAASATKAPPPSASQAPADAASPEAPSPGLPSPSPTADGEAHPFSFLLDPLTGDRLDIPQPDVWLPTIDPTGRFVTYWSGTVAPSDPSSAPPFAPGQITAWRPATGHLVLDGWSAPLAPSPSPVASGEPSSSPATSGGPVAPPTPTVTPVTPVEPTSSEPAASPGAASPAPMLGPAGTPIELAPGPVAEFDARFDPTGTRLAVWVLDTPQASAGRLWLVVLDPLAGGPNPSLQPMAAPGVQALRGFSIDSGRLGWATPPGQDGQPSRVQVLAWKGDAFGLVESAAGESVEIVR